MSKTVYYNCNYFLFFSDECEIITFWPCLTFFSTNIICHIDVWLASELYTRREPTSTCPTLDESHVSTSDTYRVWLQSEENCRRISDVFPLVSRQRGKRNGNLIDLRICVWKRLSSTLSVSLLWRIFSYIRRAETNWCLASVTEVNVSVGRE